MLNLESFDAADMAPNWAALAPQDADSLRARAFEDGYGAGWTDALEQMRNEDALRRVASEEALQAVAFGFQEAKHGLESCFMDLASQLVATLLPELRPVALRQHLAQELRTLAARHFRGRLEILCAPTSVTTISNLVQAIPDMEIAVVQEPSFTEAQVLIRVDQTDRRIDLDRVIAALNDALGDTLEQKDTVYG